MIDAFVFLAPAMRILGNVRAFEDRQDLSTTGFIGCGVDDTPATIKNLAQGIDTGSGDIVQKITAPFVSSRTFFIGGGGRRVEAILTGAVLIAFERVKITEIGDLVRHIANIEHSIAIQVRGIVVGFVVQGMITPHHQHVQWRQGAREKQR